MVNHGNMYGPDFTFLGIERCDLDIPSSYADADVVIVGAPIDSGTSHRSGAKFGPQAIRGGDYLPHDAERPHLALRIDALKEMKVVDAGDLLMPGSDLVASLEVLAQATEKISRAGAIPVILGGDHSIASADVAGIARHRGMGKISMIHFDAHADTADILYGNLASHGTPMRRLIESGAIPGKNFVQVGLRGYWPPKEIFDWMREQGMRWHTMDEIWQRGFQAVMKDAISEALSTADSLYISIDVDSLDPSFAPGTGTPEPGGIMSADLLRMVRTLCLEHNVVGIDIVEVSPAYDVSDLTVNVAHRLAFECMAGLAARRRNQQ